MKNCLLLIITATCLTACKSPPPNYNSAGSTGTLTRQERGFDATICYYDNGVTLRTQGNCPTTATSNVYQRTQ